MKTSYLGVELILNADSCGSLTGVQLPNSEQDISQILSCDCLRYCSKVVNEDYMDKNVEAYR